MGQVTPLKLIKIRFVLMTHQQFSRHEKGFLEFEFNAYAAPDGCMHMHFGRGDAFNEILFIDYADGILKKNEKIYKLPANYKNVTGATKDRFHLKFTFFDKKEKLFKVTDASTYGTYLETGEMLHDMPFDLQVGTAVCLGGEFKSEGTFIIKVLEVKRL